jgi:hypothetical protein
MLKHIGYMILLMHCLPIVYCQVGRPGKFFPSVTTQSRRCLWKQTGKVLQLSKFPRGNTDIPHVTPGFLGMQFEKSWSKLWRRSVQTGLVDRMCPRVKYDWISNQWHTPRSSQCQHELRFFQHTRKSPDRVPLDQPKMSQPPSNFWGYKITIPKRNRPEGTICAR